MAPKSRFGTDPLGKLLRQQAVPASVGFLVMSIYGIVDTIFVGQYVGAMAIGAITVVMPITFLISSIGMAIGVGGSSIISRAFGAEDDKRAYRTFGNQVMTTLTLAVLFMGLGFYFMEDILKLFGGRGEILQPSIEYFEIILIGIPFLAWAMMSNNVIRAEGHPKIAMMTLLIPAITNIILDPIFIIVLDMGIEGAAWATTLSYVTSAMYTTWFFVMGPSEMTLTWDSLKLHPSIMREMTSLGSVTLARQGTISVLSIVLNNSLFVYGGETGVAVYGIVNRMLMFANFPVIGVTQGFVPIVGYNYGAALHHRVSDLTRISIRSASLISFSIFVLIMVFAEPIVRVFTTDQQLIKEAAPAMRWVFLANPLLAFNMIGGAFYQAIGKAGKALFLSLAKQGYFLIPLVLGLPILFGLTGIWIAFPIADFGAALISVIALRQSNVRLFQKTSPAHQPAIEKS